MYRTRDHIEDWTSKCTGCGLCRKVCPSYRLGGCDPLAVMQGDLRKVFDCVGCGECSRACRHTDPKLVMLAAYSVVLDMPVSQAFLETGLSRPLRDCPSRTELPTEWTGDDVYVMPGCIVRCLDPFLEHSVPVALKALGLTCSEVPYFTCCMYPIQFGGMDDAERDGYRIRIGESARGKPLVTMCGGCSEIMQKTGVECNGMIRFLHSFKDRLPRLDREITVSLEPGCSSKIYYREMEEIAESIGCKVLRKEPGCCGKASRNVGRPLMEERQAAAGEADVIVVGCPMCFEQYDHFAGGKPVMYITELVALAAGDDSTLKYHIVPVLRK